METQTETELERGTVVADRFVIESTIGKGAMGTVYRARHSSLESDIALKVLHPSLVSNEWAVARFLEEARAVAALKSDNVARVLDTGRTSDGMVYLALEYVLGQDLEQELRESVRLPEAVAVRYALDVCSALAEAHARGIVHRDLKPENLLIERRFDGVDRVKLIDFGVAKRLYGHGARKLTIENHPVGTPSYMAPEQIVNSATVDGRADIFSLGVVLYEMLSGFLPFGGASAAETYAATLHAAPTPLEELIPEITPELAATVLRCLEKKPEERFPDVGELAVALAAHGGGRERMAASDAERTVAAVEVVVDSPRRKATSSNPTSAPVHTTLVSGNAPLPLIVPLKRRSHVLHWAGLAALLMGAGLVVLLRPGALDAANGALGAAVGAAHEGRLAISPELRTEREEEVPRPAAAPLQIAVAAWPSAGDSKPETVEPAEAIAPTSVLAVADLPTRGSSGVSHGASSSGASVKKRPLDPNLVGIPGEPIFEPEPSEPMSDELVAARQAERDAAAPGDLKEGPAAVELAPKLPKTADAVAAAPVAAPHD